MSRKFMIISATAVICFVWFGHWLDQGRGNLYAFQTAGEKSYESLTSAYETDVITVVHAYATKESDEENNYVSQKAADETAYTNDQHQLEVDVYNARAQEITVDGNGGSGEPGGGTGNTDENPPGPPYPIYSTPPVQWHCSETEGAANVPNWFFVPAEFENQ